MHMGQKTGGHETRQAAGRPARKPQRGCAVLPTHHFHVLPADTAGQPGAQRFGAGFLGREAFGKAGPGPGPGQGQAISTLIWGENPAQKALAKAADQVLDTANIDKIGADADNHSVPARMGARAACISARMRAMAAGRPMKIDSPIRKWPIFSSRTSGIAAMGETV